jgi:hypothetical protein
LPKSALRWPSTPGGQAFIGLLHADGVELAANSEKGAAVAPATIDFKRVRLLVVISFVILGLYLQTNRRLKKHHSSLKSHQQFSFT